MKGFEDRYGAMYSDKECRDDFWGIRKETWREALKWLQKNEDAHCCGDCDAVGDWTECPKDTVIRQELEDK